MLLCVLARRRNLIQSARSIRQRREFEEMVHQPAQAGTLLLDIASAPHWAGARPVEDFDAPLGAHAAIVCASISNENPPNLDD